MVIVVEGIIVEIDDVGILLELWGSVFVEGVLHVTGLEDFGG